MFSQTVSAATVGIGAHIVRVEIHTSEAMPFVHVVGLPDSAVRESKDRVYAAIKTTGFKWPRGRITVNLAPADIKKEGSSFDLPIAVGLLAASGQVSPKLLRSIALVGELALDGTLRPVHGTLSIAAELRRRKIAGIVLPCDNAREAAVIEGLDIYPMASLREAVGLLNGNGEPPLTIDRADLLAAPSSALADFTEVKGQEGAKRALEVAAAGGHNIIMVGPPGSGKTMLAKRLPTILPPLTIEESIETTTIHSVAGQLPREAALIAERPFRSPHHTISRTALVGGGTIPRPGEISLAQHGVLFLDELPEFARHVLEVLRQPMEENRVTVSRAKMMVEFPADFMLICAMNPCPCGYFTDPSKECSCSPLQIQKYMAKISGPLLDRIDIHIEVPAVKYKELSSKTTGESSGQIRERVISAREIQMKRLAGRKGMFCNADMQSKDIVAYCKIDTAGDNLLSMAITKLGLSARAYDRILKVGRTIADLANSSDIKPEHISEAIQYRSLDRNLWQT